MSKIKNHSDTDTLDAKVPQEKIAQLYDGTAWFYDIWATLTETKAQDKAIQLANIKDKTVILDVAVGTGKLFNRIVKRNPNGQNVGIDISSGMLEKAKLLLSKQSNRNYSLEFSRVLKSNGKLVLVNMTKAEYFGAGLYEKIYRISPTLLGGCRGVQLSDLIADHSFIIEKREYIQQMLFPSEVILATK